MMAAHEKSLTHHITDDPAAHGVGGLFRIQFRFQIASQGIMGECGVYDEVQHLAGGLLFRINYRGAAIWGTVMASVFFLLFAQAWARGLELSCACSGDTHKVTDYPMDTGVRLLLLGAMLMLVWDSLRQAKTPWKRSRHLDFSDA